jgi:hypothetical protein
MDIKEKCNMRALNRLEWPRIWSNLGGGSFEYKKGRKFLTG